jgi:type IV secretory pathway protease TraF
MSKFLRTTAVAATIAALALTATQAAAAPVNATVDAKAHARILKPLTLTSTQDLDLGTIVLTGASPFTATVSIDQAGVFNCDGGSSTNVACSATHQDAIYHITGTNGQQVTIAAGNVTMNGSNGGTLTLTPLFNSSLTLTNSGGAGMDFDVGGSISVKDTTTDGVYTGTFAVTADYN